MKKLISVMAIAMIAVVMVSCSSGNSPKGVVEASLECLMDKDYEGYVDLMLEEKKDEPNYAKQREQGMALMEKVAKQIEEKGGIKKYEILSEELNETGDKATVKVLIVYGNGEEDKSDSHVYKNDKGKWVADSGK